MKSEYEYWNDYARGAGAHVRRLVVDEVIAELLRNSICVYL